MKVVKPQRFVASEKLQSVGQDLVHIEHELYRVTHLHKDGLTPKELAYIERIREDLNALRIRNSTIRQRLQFSCGSWWFSRPPR